MINYEKKLDSLLDEFNLVLQKSLISEDKDFIGKLAYEISESELDEWTIFKVSILFNDYGTFKQTEIFNIERRFKKKQSADSLDTSGKNYCMSMIYNNFLEFLIQNGLKQLISNEKV